MAVQLAWLPFDMSMQNALGASVDVTKAASMSDSIL